MTVERLLDAEKKRKEKEKPLRIQVHTVRF